MPGFSFSRVSKISKPNLFLPKSHTEGRSSLFANALLDFLKKTALEVFPTTWGRFNILWILPLIYSFGLFEEFSIGLSLFSSLLFLSIESAPTRVSLTNVPSNGLSSGEPFVADRALIDKDSFLYILESHRLPLLRHSHLNYNCSLYRLLLFLDGDRLARESLASYSAAAGFGYHVLGLFFAYWSGGFWQ